MSASAFERQANVIAGIMTRRSKFFNEFMGVGQPPPFAKKLNRADKQAYFRTLAPERQQELWGQMDQVERAEVMGAG